jgi:hypothetical protein
LPENRRGPSFLDKGKEEPEDKISGEAGFEKSRNLPRANFIFGGFFYFNP